MWMKLVLTALVLVCTPLSVALALETEDFETAGDETKFVEHWKNQGTPTFTALVPGEVDQALQVGFAWSSPTGSWKYSPGATDYMMGEGTVGADMRLQYYSDATWGNASHTAGLLLKTFADDGAGNDGGYVVNLYVEGTNLKMRIGCHDHPSGSTANWEYLHDDVVHSNYVDTVLMSDLAEPGDGTRVDLGWFNVLADVSVVNDTQLQIDVDVTLPDDSVVEASFTDAGTNAYVGDGLVGVVHRQTYSIFSEYDNFVAGVAEAQCLMGDANGDGKVGIADLSALADNYGKTSATWRMGDFNDDGVVGIADLSALADNYGAIGDPCDPAAMIVPEPATLALLALGGAALLRRRR
ncbi:MAG: PEP-CTERM sorting domain-containing protein [Planctomycetota bacterium]|jgi:hypothetical protein